MAHKFSQPTLTKKSFGSAVNIRQIAHRAFQGQPVPMREGIAMYADFTAVGDLQNAMEKVDKARRFFGGLPAPCRAEFQHDPLKYVALVENILAGDPDARIRGIDLGIVEPTPQEVTTRRLATIAQKRAELLELEGPPPDLDPETDPTAE